jgi:glutaryl-CoA dehydrogenase
MTVADRPTTLNPLDFLDTDWLLSDEERLIRDNVRAYVRDKILPEVGDWFETGQLPARELAKEFGALGLLGMHLEGYGCAGASPMAYGLAVMELEAGDSGIRSLVSVQGSLAMYAIWRFGSEEQKQQWLPRMAAGEAIGCFGLTEPDFGSNPGGMRTRAKRDGDDWVLNGQKMWITNGSIADVAVVWARTEEGVRGFVVPTDTPGFSAPEIHKKLSLRASVTSELVLDDVRLPADAILPESTGTKSALACLNEARTGIVFGAIGAARACLEAAVDYAKTRVQFDKPIGAFQITQKKLADMAVEVNRGTVLAYHLARLKEAGRLRAEHVSMGKLANVNAALWVCREARQILGANGITLEYPVIRHMNNLESVVTYEGTAEVHSLVIGHALTGISAYR